MSSAAAAIGFPAVVSRPHRQLVSGQCACSGPPRQVIAADGPPSSSSSRVVVVSHGSQRGSQTQMASLPHGSRFFAGGSGSIPSREEDVSTSGRAANVLVCFRSSSSSRGFGPWALGNRQRRDNAGPEVLRALNPNNAKSAAFVSREQSLEAPHSEGDGKGDVEPLLGPAETGAQQANESEKTLRTMEEIVTVVAQRSKATEDVRSGEDPSLPTMEDIVAAAAQEGVKLQVKSFGPTFEIIVSNLDETVVFGKAEGWTKWWWPKGKILHLESVKLERGLSKQVGNVFGAGFFVGASTLRFGLDQGCKTAELLAIYDDEVAHGKVSHRPAFYFRSFCCLFGQSSVLMPHHYSI